MTFELGLILGPLIWIACILIRIAEALERKSDKE